MQGKKVVLLTVRIWKTTFRGKDFIVFQGAAEHMIDLIYDYYKLTIN